MKTLRTSGWFALLLVLVAGWAGSAGGQAGGSAPDARPHVVFIVADDLGSRDLSCYGCEDFTTPHLDALAAAGVRFTQGYVTHPYCSPSRAGLLTGRDQQRFGHEHNPRYDEANESIGIDAGTTLLPALLRDAGYATALIGKWHLGAGEPFRPAVRGFTDFYGFLGGGHDYFTVEPDGRDYRSPMWRDHAPTGDTLTYLTDDLTDEADAFIRRHAGPDATDPRPFCLVLMYNAPHAPDQVTDAYLERVAGIEHAGRRRYAALVQGIDAGVGRLRATLEELGLADNTIVAFVSDNGGRRGVSDNRPLRGNKGWLHEGGLRVPYLLAWPGRLPAGAVDERVVSTLDLFPTALAAAGLAVPDGVDGGDLLPFFQAGNDATPHGTLFWRVCGGEGYALRRGDWKLVHDVGMQTPELYDLSTDPGENRDVAVEEPGVLADLLAAYSAWDAELEAPRWTDGHEANALAERGRAAEAGARQWPMPWVTVEPAP